VPPDRDGLATLGRRLGDTPVVGVIESMSGARFVHDQLELAGWDVMIDTLDEQIHACERELRQLGADHP
jgi:hypothetical protein